MYCRKYDSFRFRLAMITSLLLISSTAMMAGTSTFDIYFTPPYSGSPAPTFAHFTYDGTMFTEFTVVWNGDSYDLAPSANFGTSRFNPPYGGCDPGVTSSAQLAFIIMTKTSTGCATPPAYVFGVGNLDDTNVIDMYFFELENGLVIADFGVGACCTTHPPAHFSSGWTLSPEPGSLLLLASGAVGLAGFLRSKSML